jgi:hypothetical protein
MSHQQFRKSESLLRWAQLEGVGRISDVERVAQFRDHRRTCGTLWCSVVLVAMSDIVISSNGTLR